MGAYIERRCSSVLQAFFGRSAVRAIRFSSPCRHPGEWQFHARRSVTTQIWTGKLEFGNAYVVKRRFVPKKVTKTDEEEVPKWHHCLVLRYVPFIYRYIFFDCGMRMYCMLSSKILFCKLKLFRTCSLVKSVYVMETIIYSIHTCYRNGSCYFKYMRQNIFFWFSYPRLQQTLNSFNILQNISFP